MIHQWQFVIGRAQQWQHQWDVVNRKVIPRRGKGIATIGKSLEIATKAMIVLGNTKPIKEVLVSLPPKLRPSQRPKQRRKRRENTRRSESVAEAQGNATSARCCPSRGNPVVSQPMGTPRGLPSERIISPPGNLRVDDLDDQRTALQCSNST